MEIQLLNFETNIFRFIKDNENYIDFCPDRGGLITNWTSSGKKILYFDERRFLDKKLSIRGGIPVLFPICGNIDQRLSIFGSKYLQLPQHGFARDLIWQFQFMKEDGSLNLSLKDSDWTRKYYPFSFEIKMNIRMQLNSLIFEVEIFNKSHEKMPVNFGLHPYFNISDFKNLEFVDNPLNCQDQERNTISNTLEELNKINLGVDLLMYTSGRSSFRDKIFKREVTLNHPYPFDLGVIWSDPPRRMICLEPWTSPRNSFVDGFRNIMIPSNDSKRLNASIQIKSLK